MQDKIMQLLSSADKFFSGEEISNLLGVSRTAVWKHINSLKNAGYKIEARPRQGYRLQAVPDILYPREVLNGLADLQIMGKPGLIHREQIDSTNALARELAEQGSEEGTLVIAEEQLGGKGRLGRQWVSPRGLGIWLSVILRPHISPALAPQITLVASLAVLTALNKTHDIKAGIKWPNDLLVNGRKICGILTEMKAEIDAVDFVILGMGINVNLSATDFPEEARGEATSVLLETGRKADRKELLRVLLTELDHAYHNFCEEGFPYIRRKWLENNITIGRQVKITTYDQKYYGIAVGIDAEGALIVDCQDGEKRVFHAGDVTLKE